MAVYMKSMSLEETSQLALSMMKSGEVLTWPTEWNGYIVDKHSTGGVGDKISLPLAPALAACGLKVRLCISQVIGHKGGLIWTWTLFSALDGAVISTAPHSDKSVFCNMCMRQY